MNGRNKLNLLVPYSGNAIKRFVTLLFDIRLSLLLTLLCKRNEIYISINDYKLVHVDLIYFHVIELSID